MPARVVKKKNGPSLYSTFIDAYMKAHPEGDKEVRNFLSLLSLKLKRAF